MSSSDDYTSPPASPSQDEINRIMQQQNEKLKQMSLTRGSGSLAQGNSSTFDAPRKPLPTGRPLLINRGQRNRTYWDSNQEGAFSSTKQKQDSEQLTIVGKIQRSKYHMQPEYKFDEKTSDDAPKLIHLKTERCLLRPLNYESDAEINLLVELFQNVELSRKIPAPLREETVMDTKDKALVFAKSHHELMNSAGLLTISDKNTTNMLLGVAGVWPVFVYKQSRGRVADNESFDENTMDKAFEIGFALVQNAWAKGLATESVLAIHHLMNRVSLDKNKVFAYIDSKECRAQHVLEKIGMKKQEGTVEYRGEKGIQLYAF